MAKATARRATRSRKDPRPAMNSTEKPFVSIVVRCRNEAKHLPKLIYGLARQDSQDFEVVLVDSGSEDESVELAKRAGWRVLEISPQDFSFGRSLNIGCAAANGELIVSLSAHVYPVRADFIENLTEVFNPSGHATVAYGRQVGDNRSHFSERVLMAHWFPNERLSDQGHAFTNNANACFPKVLWEKLRFDEELTGLEDIDFAQRALSSAGRVIYVDDAAVVHVHQERWAQIRNRYRREAKAYKVIFPEEKMSLFMAVRLWARNVARDALEAKRQGALGREIGSIMIFRGNQFLGAWQGFREVQPLKSELLGRMYHPPQSGDLFLEVDHPKIIDYGDSIAE